MSLYSVVHLLWGCNKKYLYEDGQKGKTKEVVLLFYLFLSQVVNICLFHHLTLVPEQKKELESDLVQESVLKDYEKVPSYKASLEFKNKMFASMRAQRTSLVPLYKIGDEITKVKQEI